MENIDITINIEYNNEKFPITINPNISIEELKDILGKKLNIDIVSYELFYNGKFLDDFLDVNEYSIKNNDIILLKKVELLVANESYPKESPQLFNVSFFTYLKDIKLNMLDLSDLLKLCLLRYISKKIDTNKLSFVTPPLLKEILSKLRGDYIHYENNKEKDIKKILSEIRGNNIIEYSKYIGQSIIYGDIFGLLQIFNDEEEVQNEIKNYWSCLSSFNERNILFEKNFNEDLRKSFFEYSLISLVIIQRDKMETFEKGKKDCENKVNRFLYHGSQVEPISKIMTTAFKYAKKAFFGLGVYFSSMLDYIGFYCGGHDYDSRRDKFDQIMNVGSVMSVIASEIYYDKSKYKIVDNDSLYMKEFNDFPSYKEMKEKYPQKMVEKNGINFIQVEPDKGHAIKHFQKNGQFFHQDSFEKKEIKKGTFIGDEYVISEMEQICPLYGLSLKRNEFCVIWRDLNFEGYNEYIDFLQERKNYSNSLARMNFYFESSTEEALKLVFRKRHNKIIFITSVGLDLSGKKFIEVARKILGAKIIVLFLSSNHNHLSWIKDFPNALYTTESEIYEKYLEGFNEEKLKDLKRIIEEKYQIQLREFDDEFLKYPLFIEEGNFSGNDFDLYSKNIREVAIYSETYKKYLYIDDDGCVCLDKENKNGYWDVIINDDDKEITLKCNMFYLGVISGAPWGEPFMKRWKYTVDNEGKYYSLEYFNKKDNNILAIIYDGESVGLSSIVSNDSKFLFVDKPK